MKQLSQDLAPESVLITTTQKVVERGKLRVEVGRPQIFGPFHLLAVGLGQVFHFSGPVFPALKWKY